MPSAAGKWGLSVASAALAAVALYPLYRAYRPQPKLIDFSRGGAAPEASAPVPAADWREPPAPADSLPGVLEVDRPRFPPSAFVRKAVSLQRFAENDRFSQADPYVNHRYKPNLVLRRPWEEHPEGVWFQSTNELGMREDDQVLRERPDLRILIAGDSHTDGVCNNHEAFGNLVEARLRREHPELSIESLNAGRGGYAFYQYLGTLERFLYLQPDVFVVGVYGGNDFEFVLTQFHEFNGTVRPPGHALYGELIDKAIAINQTCLAQAFLSFKYFDVHPGQMEVALQVARDITTEILVTCMRHAVHPIFVYIPAMPDVEWQQHAQIFEEVARALEVSPEGLRTTDVLADSYLAFLRELRVDVLDMRPAFRARPGNYWLADHHINLQGQQLIADALYPLITAARPLDAVRTRRAPGSAGDPLALLSPGSAAAQAAQPPAEIAAPHLFGEQALAELLADRPHTVHDPFAGYRYEAYLDVPADQVGLAGASFGFVTNGHGLREDEELAQDVDLRVVITGDDHVAGVCPNPRVLGNVAEAELRRRHPDLSIEVLNAAVAGYTFQNYLGVLQRSLALRPDAFVVVFSPGSDFLEALRVDRLLEPRPPEKRRREKQPGPIDASGALPAPAMAQFFDSIVHFQERPLRSHQAFDLAMGAMLEIRRICGEAGIQLIVLQLPSAADAEWELHSAALEGARTVLALDRQQVDTNATMARALVRELERYGIAVLDLGEALSGKSEPLYQPESFLINPSAHRLIGKLLVEHLDQLAAALD
jgi:lysophospholipase L1-like esterase